MNLDRIETIALRKQGGLSIFSKEICDIIDRGIDKKIEEGVKQMGYGAARVDKYVSGSIEIYPQDKLDPNMGK